MTAISRTEGPPAASSTGLDGVAREVGRDAEDEALVAEAEHLLQALLGDPTALLQAAQAHLRDVGIELREDRALSDMDRAELDEALARLAEEAERAARAAAESSGILGQILGWIGTAIACLVSVATSWCTGGASLALAAVAIGCMVAASTVQQLAASGVITDPGVAAVVSSVLTVIAALCSFGSNATAVGAQAASIAVSAASALLTSAAALTRALVATGLVSPNEGGQLATVLSLLASLCALGGGGGGGGEAADDVAATIAEAGKLGAGFVQIGAGVNGAVGTAFTYGADLSEIEADRHEMHAEDSRTSAEGLIDELGALMRSARRTSEKLLAVREARAAAMRAAVRV